MKKVYNVSYDLNKSGKDYEGLYQALRSYQDWYHLLDSTWLVCTFESADQIWNRLSSHIDNDDRILIVQLSGNYSGWLPKVAWNWLEARLPLYAF